MLERLLVFLDVCRGRSFSAVAKERNLAVSSITRQIDLLEAELGTVLFDRSTRGLPLTEAGTLFHPRASALVEDMQDALAELLDLHSEPSGPLTITAPSAFGRLYVAPAATSFVKRYPRIELVLKFDDGSLGLETTRSDIAIRIGPVSHLEAVDSFLAPVRNILCASPDYLERSGSPANVKELLSHSCLAVLDESAGSPGSWTFLQSGPRRMNIRGSLRSNDEESLLRAAIDGLGICHLPTWFVATAVAAGELIPLLSTADPSVKVLVGIHAVLATGRRSARSRLFIDHFKRFIGTPAHWDVSFDAVAGKPVLKVETA